MLSVHSIASKLGKEIIIWPFKAEQLKGVGYNLTIGPFAFGVGSKKSLEIVEKEYTGKIYKNFIVPPGETALVMTEETVWVNDKIGGTFHSKVDKMSAGFSAISTTLDPGWIGPLLIAITNNTAKDNELRIGDTFTTLIFDYAIKPKFPAAINPPGRIDRLQRYISDDELQIVSRWMEESWRNDINCLKYEIGKHDKPFELPYIDGSDKIKKIMSDFLPWIPALLALSALSYLMIFTGAAFKETGSYWVACMTAIGLGISMTRKRD